MIVSAREEGAGVTVIAVITLVFGLWWVFGELQDALNTIWGVTSRPGRGFLVILRERFWSFTLVVGIGFLLLVSLAVSAWLAALGEFFAHLLPAPAAALEAVNRIPQQLAAESLSGGLDAVRCLMSVFPRCLTRV